jgi:hypothetical protein
MSFINSKRFLRTNKSKFEGLEGWGLKDGRIKSLKACKKPNPYPLKGV